MALCAAALTLACAAAPAQAVTQTFDYTGSEQVFTVPIGVFHMHVVAIGGSGGAGELVQGGAAAQVTADLTVTPGQALYVEVGGRGADAATGGAGGFNGGGSGGGIGAGGGGGATDIRTSPQSAGLAPEDRLLVAGGGGGTGGIGHEGTGPGAGGAAGSDGSEAPGSGNQGGGKGTQSTGGVGGGGAGGTGGEGELGLGGSGAGSGSTEGGPGGGGGSGYYGGGGGGGGVTYSGGGGGGGSSLVPEGGSLTSALLATPPQVQITYNPPPSIGIVAPANGATYVRGQALSAVYSCAAGEGTGLKTCTGPVANGAALDTSTAGSHTFTVNAEDTDGGRAAQTVTYTVVAPTVTCVFGGEGLRAPCPGGSGSALPDTIIGSHPKATLKTKKKAKARFTFSSSTSGATFKCRLDRGAFTPCASPKSYKVKPGKHRFSVEAVSSAGTDPTPATFSFKVVKKKL